VPPEPFLGEIMMVGWNFEPRGWAFCDGRLLNVADNVGLFNLFGTTYGGDGRTNFALPDLRGRVPMHRGPSASGTTYNIGQKGGAELVTLTEQQLPTHTHPFGATTATGTQQNPANNLLANSQGPQPYIEQDPDNNLNQNMLSKVGNSQPHENRQPYQGINFVIALEGIYPTQG
jgi:microcystin-dependent protein